MSSEGQHIYAGNKINACIVRVHCGQSVSHELVRPQHRFPDLSHRTVCIAHVKTRPTRRLCSRFFSHSALQRWDGAVTSVLGDVFPHTSSSTLEPSHILLLYNLQVTALQRIDNPFSIFRFFPGHCRVLALCSVLPAVPSFRLV